MSLDFIIFPCCRCGVGCLESRDKVKGGITVPGDRVLMLEFGVIVEGDGCGIVQLLSCWREAALGAGS